MGDFQRGMLELENRLIRQMRKRRNFFFLGNGNRISLNRIEGVVLGDKLSFSWCFGSLDSWPVFFNLKGMLGMGCLEEVVE